MRAGATGELTVVVVDPEPDRRARVQAILDASDAVRVVESTGDAGHALARVLDEPPDALLLDAKLPDQAALGVCWAVQQQSPATAVVLMAGPEDTATAYAAITYGAASCLQRADILEVCVDALRGAIRGEYLVPPLIATRVLHDVDAYSQSSATPFGREAPLTATEREVLLGLAGGETPAEIAARHEVTARLVNLHTGYAVAKLQRHAEAARALATPQSA